MNVSFKRSSWITSRNAWPTNYRVVGTDSKGAAASHKIMAISSNMQQPQGLEADALSCRQLHGNIAQGFDHQ